MQRRFAQIVLAMVRSVAQSSRMNQISDAHATAAYEMGYAAEKAFAGRDYVVAARCHHDAAALWTQAGVPTNADIQEAAARQMDECAAGKPVSFL